MTDLLRELTIQGDKLLNCVHCGFCLPACPTYSRLGVEGDSPRGRLRFMEAVVTGRMNAASDAFQTHLDLCLGCRACESVCPSGVEYGKLLEGARDVAARAAPPHLLARLLTSLMSSRAPLAMLGSLGRVLRAGGGAAGVVRLLPDWGIVGKVRLGLAMVAATSPSRRMAWADREAPNMRSGSFNASHAPEECLGRGRTVALLTGCVQASLLDRVNQATVRVLEANGFRLVEAPAQRCCGALHAHSGDLTGARRLARMNVRAFEEAGVELVAVNAAGCGAIMKEYGHLLSPDPEYRDRGQALASRVRDVTELLDGPGLRSGGELPLTVSYDAACHLLHAQRISEAPLRLMGSVERLCLVPLRYPDECCGGAGIYGITHLEMGGAIGRDKIRDVLESGAEVVATGNPGCMMQIGAGLLLEGVAVGVVHPVELLDESYRRGGLYSGPQTG